MFFKKKTEWYKLFESSIAANAYVAEGKVNTISVNNKKVCIAHTKEGYFAMQDKCPHNGASLGNGFCTLEGSIVCPVHRYSFDLKTGRATSGGGDAARTYPLEIREDGMYIGFEKTVWF
jgi:nitrite reductase/ring-hydroxylating ferredoxin subunit